MKLEERQLVALPTLSRLREKIRHDLTVTTVREAIADTPNRRIIRCFNLDGSEIDADPQSIRSGR